MNLKKLTAAALSALVLCMGTALLPSAARNLENEKSSDSSIGTTYEDGMFTFMYAEGGVELYSVDSSALAVILPDETDGRMIVGISDGAFYGCTSLESVSIGKYVRSIGNAAFSGCESLRSVKMPQSVVSIGKEIFSGCTSLTSVELSPNIKEIPEAAFYMCAQLEQVTIPEGVTAIGPEAFYNCFLLSSVDIPESVETIGDYAFAFCGNLTDTALPSTVNTLGSGVYCGCEGLTEFTVTKDMTDLGTLSFIGCKNIAAYEVEDGNETYTAKDGVLYTAGGSVLFAYPAGNPAESFAVPEGVTTIYDASFFTAEHLKEVTFPSTLHYIGAGAFDYCTSLKSAELPDGVEIIYDNAFSDCTALSSVRLPETLTHIGNYAFYACPALKEVTVPSKCTVGDYAFGYTDGSETDENGNYIPVKIKGFKQHSNVNIVRILLIIAGILVLGVIVFLLVRVIRKTQMTAEEKEVIADADEEEYESIAGDDEETESADEAEKDGRE